MSFLGNSGAALYVVKIGENLHEQWQHCQRLGDIAPRVYSFFTKNDLPAYEMEILSTAPHLSMGTFCILWERLKDVWKLQAPHRVWDWLSPLLRWASQEYPWLYAPISRMYGGLHSLVPQWQCIHGDPTLANVMYRPRSHDMVIIDPLPPRVGEKIPWIRAVDVGKILQSVIGWEEQLGVEISFDEGEAAEFFEGQMSFEEIQAGWLWCAIHCARIVPYARRNNPRLVEWALDKSKAIIQMREL